MHERDYTFVLSFIRPSCIYVVTSQGLNIRQIHSMCVYACVSFLSSYGDGQYRCPRAVSTALCVHDVQCLDPECRHHGVCEATECSCEAPWTGVMCESVNCSATSCNGHGNCTDGTYMHTC